MDEDKPRCGLRCARITDKGICDRCTRLTAEDLEAMDGLEAEVRERLYEAQSNAMGDRVSGSRERPLGFSVDALSLIGAVNDPSAPMRVRNGDEQHQVGPLPMLDSLSTQAYRVADERGFTYHSFTYPKVSVALVAAFLLNHHPWTVQQPWADEYAFEVRGCAHEARRLCGLYDAPVDIKVGVPCSRAGCDALALYEIPGEDRIECGACHKRLTGAEYREWTVRYATYAKGQSA